MRTFLTLLTILVLLAALTPAMPARAASVDFGIPDGHFYSQGNNITGSSAGFTIADDAVAPLWSWYQAMGGASALGYPTSRRFMWLGLVTQATEREVLQWNGDTGQVQLTNVLDILHDQGADKILLQDFGIPPVVNDGGDNGLSWDAIVARHLALLDANEAIRTTYFADPDPLTHYGLPMVAQDTNFAFVVRAQRAVFKNWKLNGAELGAQVTVLTAGQLAEDAHIIPSTALQPEPVPLEKATPNELPEGISPAFRQSILETRAAVAKITVLGTQNSRGVEAPIDSGSGVIMDPTGYIVTNNHVVDVGAFTRLFIRLADGRSFDGHLVGTNPDEDLAVIKIDGNNLPTAAFGSSEGVAVGDSVAAIGYSPFVPGDPSINLGEITAIGQSLQEPGGPLLTGLLQTDAGLFPGFSGGPLLDERGAVVGINTAVASRLGRIDPERGLVIPADLAQRLARALIQAGQRTSFSPSLAPPLQASPVRHGW